MEIKRSQTIAGLNSNLGVSDSKKAEMAKEAYAGKANSSAAKKSGVNVSLSEASVKKAEDMKKAFELAKTTSPIREDRVAELREKIANGTYQIDSGKIADGMLMEAVKDELSTSL